jgi:hypothetical protein
MAQVCFLKVLLKYPSYRAVVGMVTWEEGIGEKDKITMHFVFICCPLVRERSLSYGKVYSVILGIINCC